MRRFSVRAAWLLIVVIALAPAAIRPAADAQQMVASASEDPPRVVDTISLPGTQPVALALYEAGNKLFVTDDVSGDLLVIDGTTGQVVSTVAVGRSAFEIVVSEGAEKVYVASSGGTSDGSGLISVIDADTGSLITRLDIGAEREVGGPAPGQANWFRLANDEVHGKVYVSLFCPFCIDLGVIDVATDEFTPILSGVAPTFSHGFGVEGVNAVTNKAFAVNAGNLFVIDGLTYDTDVIDLGDISPLSVAVNDVENKVYMWAIGQDVRRTLVVVHPNTRAIRFIGPDVAEDTEPLVFNPQTNTVFSGAQVGQRGVVVDGASDEVVFVNYRAGGMGDGDVRYSTDNAYFANDRKTFLVHGSTRRLGVMKTEPSKADTDSLVANSVVIDQSRGLVYVVNDDEAGRITVIQDGVIPPRPDTIITGGPSRRINKRTATFRFGSSQTGSTFRCKLDWDPWRKCTSPKRYRGLSLYRHVFRVKAKNSLGMTDPTPAKRVFKVVP